jgi:hypothetical protein
MNKITPFFTLNGVKYEIKKTRWLVAEYNRLNEESPLTDEDRADAIKASNLVADAQKFAEKEKEWWDKLCVEPTEENRNTYFMFKKMSDDAVSAYNEFVVTHNALQDASRHNINVLEQIAIKGIAEQYFHMNEAEATKIWEAFVDSQENHNIVGEWLTAMAQCLFMEEDEKEEGNDFLSQMRRQRGTLRKKR